MRHDAGRVVLKRGEQGDDVVAAGAGNQDLIAGHDPEFGGTRPDHLDGRRPRAAREDLYVETVLAVIGGIESAELGIGLPVQS